MGEGEITATTTITAPLNRNNKKIQHEDSNNKKNKHEDSRMSLDASRKTSTDGRFAPPPNNVLASFAVAIVPCTTPRSYAAPLPPSI
jgi:hypothetical protein